MPRLPFGTLPQDALRQPSRAAAKWPCGRFCGRTDPHDVPEPFSPRDREGSRSSHVFPVKDEEVAERGGRTTHHGVTVAGEQDGQVTP